LDVFELGAGLESAFAESLELFVADDAFEGEAMGESHLFDDFELIGESDTREGRALLECVLSYIRSVAVLTEYHTHKMETANERTLRKGSWSLFRRAMRLGHLKEISIEPWVRLLSSSLLCSASERS